MEAIGIATSSLINMGLEKYFLKIAIKMPRGDTWLATLDIMKDNQNIF